MRSYFVFLCLLWLAACTPGDPPTSSSAALTGLYVYFADAANFTDCATGIRYPVAMESASIDLERGYLDARAEPMTPVLVRLIGRIEDRPKIEGDGAQASLIATRLLGFAPEATCGSSGALLTYACAEDVQIVVHLANDEKTATLWLDHDIYELDHVQSASGSKFSDGQVTFWNKGDEALVEVDGEIVHRSCNSTN